jgi:hypothetical protein
MSFIVTKTAWLETELVRVRDIILMPRFWGVKWTHAKLRQALSDVGLNYSKEDIEVLNEALHAQGIVEDVPD